MEYLNKMPTLCLNMIVKDEAHIIKETLNLLCNAVKIDYYVICDTGSTDNTVEIITLFFNELCINGEIFHHIWRDFGHNRSLALECAKNKCDYTFVFDADDYIVGDLKLLNLEKDSYILKFGNESNSYQRKCILKSRYPWKYMGVLHEYITCDQPGITVGFVGGDYYVVSGKTGSRNKNTNKYLNDARVLESGFIDSLMTNDGLHSRYAYYCANSYFDAGIKDKAIEWYQKTLTLDGWFDEKYNSCLKLYQLIPDESRFYYLVESYSWNPKRVEGIFELIKYYTIKAKYTLAWKYYTFIQDYYENEYYPSDGDVSSKLFARVKDYTFYLPYYMIIVCEHLKRHNTGLLMYKLIFKRKSYQTQWWMDNLMNNLQFYPLTPDINEELTEYIDFVLKNGITNNSWKC